MRPCNILIDLLPQSVLVGEDEFPVNWDFRTGILFEQLMQDHKLDPREKTEHALALWYPEQVPSNIDDAVDQIIWFYSCGKQTPGKGGGKHTKKDVGTDKRIYDFDVDAPLIYSAFMAHYRIDLQDVEDLHWWKFQAMFVGLPASCEIMKIMGYRATDVRKIKNKAERAFYAEMQAKYQLPSMLTTEEKQVLAGSIFAGQMIGG